LLPMLMSNPLSLRTRKYKHKNVNEGAAWIGIGNVSSSFMCTLGKGQQCTQSFVCWKCDGPC